jgi:hypothetical protein
MLADEPDQTFVPFWYMDPAVFVTQANAAKTKTTLPIIADFQRAAWSVPTDVAPYTPGVDFFMAEPYGADFRPLSYAVNMFRSFPPARAMWIAQDATEANLIVPKAYWAVAEGVTGIAYFTWSDFQGQPAKLTAALQVFAELGQLKSVIFSENIDSLVTAPPGVKVAARYNNGSAYLMAANNPEAQNLAAAFQMAGLVAGQQIQVMFENRNLTATAGRCPARLCGEGAAGGVGWLAADEIGPG